VHVPDVAVQAREPLAEPAVEPVEPEIAPDGEPVLPELPEGFERAEGTFEREDFESDPLGWVDKHRGF